MIKRILAIALFLWLLYFGWSFATNAYKSGDFVGKIAAAGGFAVFCGLLGALTTSTMNKRFLSVPR